MLLPDLLARVRVAAGSDVSRGIFAGGDEAVIRPRLADARLGGGEIEIAFYRAGNERIELGILERRPPQAGIRRRLGRRALRRGEFRGFGLPENLRRMILRPLIIRADVAPDHRERDSRCDCDKTLAIHKALPIHKEALLSIFRGQCRTCIRVIHGFSELTTAGLDDEEIGGASINTSICCPHIHRERMRIKAVNHL